MNIGKEHQRRMQERSSMRRHSYLAQTVLAGFAAVWICTGCSRATINYQVAESLGTLGQFENNEPVETPKMREQREQVEAQAAAQTQLDEQMEHAQRLADGYWYEEAIEYLNGLEKNEFNNDAINAAVEEYTRLQDSIIVYEGKVPHLCFPHLIEDTGRAFDGDDYAYTYSGSLLTVSEFRGILQELYDKNYVLVDLYNVAAEETDNRGLTTMEFQDVQLPEGKRPVVISQDNVNYKGLRASDGIATRLVLDGEGKVKALYTDTDGHELKGDYDLVPVLESFIEENPGFSYRGAKGIVTVSASDGVFGYTVYGTSVTTDVEENQQTVRDIADALTKSGWHIGCAGYNHGYMNDLSIDALHSEIEKWKEQAGAFVGDAQILFYPYGAEVESTEGLKYLVSEGFHYLCGLWGDTDFMELGEGYLRQTRRFVDGYTLLNAPGYFTGLFDASVVRDPDR